MMSPEREAQPDNQRQNAACSRRQLLAVGAGLTGLNLLDRHWVLANDKAPTRAGRLDNSLSTDEPASVGVSSERLQRISDRLRTETSSGEITSASVLVARRGVIVLHQGFGKLRPDSDAPNTQPDTTYLLASITKPVT